jgi:Xaa-Pro aminopeptidase
LEAIAAARAAMNEAIEWLKHGRPELAEVALMEAERNYLCRRKRKR